MIVQLNYREQSLGSTKSLRGDFMSNVLDTLVLSLHTSFHKSNRSSCLCCLVLLPTAAAQWMNTICCIRMKTFLVLSFSDFYLWLWSCWLSRVVSRLKNASWVLLWRAVIASQVGMFSLCWNVLFKSKSTKCSSLWKLFSWIPFTFLVTSRTALSTWQSEIL